MFSFAVHVCMSCHDYAFLYYLEEHPHVQIIELLPVSLIVEGGNVWQSWRWWPCCLSLRGHACWGRCRSPCKQKTHRRCSCWAAMSPWTCTHPQRPSVTKAPERERQSVNLMTDAGWTSQQSRSPPDLYFGKELWGKLEEAACRCPFQIQRHTAIEYTSALCTQ